MDVSGTVAVTLPVTEDMARAGVSVDENGCMDCQSVIHYRNNYSAVQWFECSAKTNPTLWLSGTDHVWVLRRIITLDYSSVIRVALKSTAPMLSCIGGIFLCCVMLLATHVSVGVAAALSLAFIFMSFVGWLFAPDENIRTVEHLTEWIPCNADTWENVLSLVQMQEMQHVDAREILCSVDETVLGIPSEDGKSHSRNTR